MDIQTGKQLRQLDGYIGTTQSMVFSPDGKMLASSSGGSKVLLWDVAQRTYLPIKIENDSPVSSLAFTPDGTSLVTGAGNGSILFWDPATGMQHNTFNLPNGQVSSMAFSSDGRMLALGFEDGRTSLWDPATWKLLRAFTGLAKPVEGLVISADGKTLSATTQNTLILWNTETGAQINSANGWAMAISSDGKQCAYEAGDPMRYFSLYDARTGRQLHKLDNVYAMGAYVSTASFSPDGKIIALGISTCGTDACTISISLHDVATGYPLTVFTGVDGGLVASTNINRLVFSPDGKVLASNSDDGTITLWDTSEIDK